MEKLWTPEIEQVLESIRCNCLVASRKNKRHYLSLKRRLAMYKVPIIIISAINSVWAVGAGKYVLAHYISTVSSVLSLTVGVIGSIALYIAIESDMERSLLSYKDYYQLAIEIYKTITIDESVRDSSGRDYLNDVYTRYVQIFDKSIVTKSTRGAVDYLFAPPLNSDTPSFTLAIPPSPTSVGRSSQSSIDGGSV